MKYSTSPPVWMKRKESNLGLYRALVEEGRKLKDSCRLNKAIITYINPRNKEQAQRSVMASVQRMGLEITVKSLAKYAQYFHFNESEYGNLVENLTENYCSENLSVFSIKKLKKVMMESFHGNDFKLPGEVFPSLIQKYGHFFEPERTYRQKEFKANLDLFKIFCSWQGAAHDATLLAPLLRDPVWMAYTMEQLSSVMRVWNPKTGTIEYKRDANTTKALCRGFICRKTDTENFEESFYYSAGSARIRDDFQRLYCQHFKQIDFRYWNIDPKIKKMIHGWGLDDLLMLNRQMIALVTGFPDFLIRSRPDEGPENSMAFAIEHYWRTWASTLNSRPNYAIAFEAALAVELVDRSLYFNPYSDRLSVEFDINMGEFDRTYQKVGKIGVETNLSLYKKGRFFLYGFLEKSVYH